MSVDNQYAEYTDFKIAQNADGTISIKEIGKDADGYIIIPDEINGQKVSVINERAFRNAKIKGIILPKELKNIGKEAFNRCTNLQEVKLSNNVKIIEKNVFSSCKNLEYIDLSNVEKIVEMSFAFCDNLKKITVGEKLAHIEAGAFQKCFNFSWHNSVSPNGNYNAGELTLVKYFADSNVQDKDAMYCLGKYYIKQAEEEEGRKWIEKAANNDHYEAKIWMKNNPMEMVTDNSLEDKEVFTLNVSTAENSIDMPANKETEDKKYEDDNLTNTNHIAKEAGDQHIVDTNNSPNLGSKIELRTVEEISLVGKKKIKESEQEDQVGDSNNHHTIKKDNQDEVDIKVDKSIVTSPIGGLPGEVKEKEKFQIEKTENDDIKIVGYMTNNEEKVTIPQIVDGKTVKIIGRGAFYSKKYIKEINLPSTIENIESLSFRYCKSLSIIKIPHQLKKIGEEAFDGCESLYQIKFPDGVKIIRPRTFKNCTMLSSIELPDSLEDIGTRAFQGCSSLEEITLPPNLKNLGLNVFDGCDKLKKIRVSSSAPEDVQKKLKVYRGGFLSFLSKIEIIKY